MAEDVVAETFLVAWRRVDELPSEPLPWLIGVARKVLANRRRSDDRRVALSARLRSLPACPESADPGDTWTAAERVRAALAALPAGEREVIELLAWEGLSPAEIATALEVAYGGGAASPIRLGVDRYFLIQVPATDQATALADGVQLIALNSHRQVAARVPVPPLRDSDPQGNAHDRQQPIYVSTISDATDFTLVFGIEGQVNLPGSTTLELTYPDGSVVRIPTDTHGGYHFSLPPDRRDDFARSFGVLTARNAAGQALDTAPVGSVAAWRARNH